MTCRNKINEASLPSNMHRSKYVSNLIEQNSVSDPWDVVNTLFKSLWFYAQESSYETNDSFIESDQGLHARQTLIDTFGISDSQFTNQNS